MDKDIMLRSLKEVGALFFISILPNIVAISILSITESFSTIVQTSIIPGELVAYSLSLIAPSLYLIIKSHGHAFKLPYLGVVAIISLVVYSITIVLVMIARNKWVPAINMDPQQGNIYFVWSVIFLAISLAMWIYSTYHNERFGDYHSTVKAAQNSFNSDFVNAIKPTPNPGNTP